MHDRDGSPPQERSSSFAIPPDVEKRYQALQEEMRQAVTLSSTITQGESREDRYQRRQRLRVRRQEFESNARYPRRALSTPLTIAAMIGAIIVLCAVSVLGGTIIGGAFGKQPDITATAAKFWNAMESRDYGIAHEALDPLISLQDFALKAQTAQETMGDITDWSFVPKSQQGGGSADRIGAATYTISRSGTKAIKPGTYQVTLNFIFTPSGWVVNNVGALFDVPRAQPTPQGTPSPIK